MCGLKAKRLPESKTSAVTDIENVSVTHSIRGFGPVGFPPDTSELSTSLIHAERGYTVQRGFPIFVAMIDVCPLLKQVFHFFRLPLSCCEYQGRMDASFRRMSVLRGVQA
eukprot:1180573-Prorocentrum_minimum.AAC.4